MLGKKQIVTMVSIAIISFLIGTTVNFVAFANTGNPWDKIWTAISELQGKVNSIEEKQNQVRWIRFYEPDETMVDQYVWKDVAVFVWAPRNALNNAILLGRSYFQYLTPTHGMAYRILVNEYEINYNSVPEQTEYQQSIAFLITESPKPNQSTYTITFQCRSVGPSYVKDINILIEVMDGLPASG